MTTQQRPRPERRYPTLSPRRKKSGGRDPYLLVLMVQLAACAVLLGLAYAAERVQPPFYEELSSGYLRLIVARQTSLPAFSGQALAEGYASLRDNATDAVAGIITDLLNPGEAAEASPPAQSAAAQPEQTPPLQEEASSALEPKAEETSAALTGAGGWMGLGDGDGRTPPSSCALSPILLSAWLEPPVSGTVTSAYGYRPHPVTESDDFHRGVDIAAPQGTEIRAPLPGIVSEVDSSAIYGNFITLDHGNGVMTTYCHCDTIVAKQGENLRKGELLATVGSTGISTGPHVHFEIQKDGRYYNPAWLLEGMNGYGI